MRETKTCPKCGATVLAGARVCKECRHGFVETTTEDRRPAAGTLTAPDEPARRSRRPVILVLAALAIGTLTLILVLGGDTDDGSTPTMEANPEAVQAGLSGVRVEQELTQNVGGRIGGGVDEFTCPSKTVVFGGSTQCVASFNDGREQTIIVELSGTGSDPRLDISLP